MTARRKRPDLDSHLSELYRRIELAEKRPFDDRPGGGTALFHEDSKKVENTGDQLIRLTHLPIENSEHVYWNAVYQPSTEWTRTNKIVTVPGGPMRVNDWLHVEYAYVEAPPAPVTPSLTATAGFDLPRDTLMTSLPLPAATQLGDVLVINAISGFGGWAVCEIPDGRMTRIAHHTTHGSGPGGRLWGVWVGYADNLGPLNVQMQAEYATMGQFAKGAILAIRGLDGDLEWDPARIAVGPNYASGTGHMPAVPGEGSGAVASVLGSHGGQLGGYWASPAMDPYVLSVNSNDSGTMAHLGWADERVIGATAGAPNVVAAWRGVVVGFK
jgi:hypothetical protein